MFGLFKKQPAPLMSAEESAIIVEAINEAERNTTGEIRVFVESRCNYVDAWDRAWQVFHHLEMSKTQHRNAVLVYIATLDKQVAIIADEAIFKKVGGPEYWVKELEMIKQGGRNQQLAQGVVNAINDIGVALHEHFPHKGGSNKNELPNEIVFGK